MSLFRLVLGTFIAAATSILSGCSSDETADPCTPGDNDGVNMGHDVDLVSVSDTAFTVGGVDSGSTDPNITVENLDTVSLTLTNVGTRPHDMVIQCIPSGLPATCEPTSCFPGMPASAAGYITLVPSLQPGESKTVTFVTPAVEGAYTFRSDAPADLDGGASTLVGEFVLM